MISLVWLLGSREGAPLPAWLIILFFVFTVGQVVFGFRWLKKNKAKSAKQLTSWVQQNGWQMVELEGQSSTGPFSKWSGKGVIFFRFIVADAKGKPHTGWAKFDHSFWGKGKMEIKWEEDLALPITPTVGQHEAHPIEQKVRL